MGSSRADLVAANDRDARRLALAGRMVTAMKAARRMGTPMSDDLVSWVCAGVALTAVAGDDTPAP